MELLDSPPTAQIDKLDLQSTPTPPQEAEIEHQSDTETEEEEGVESEFSFAYAASSSPISAEEIFDGGQIKPIFPWLGASEAVIPVENVFVERKDVPATDDIGRVAEGPYCAWSKNADSASSEPDSCKKSNSTGFSKLRRFRDLLHRSQSDGKDTFVFLTTDKKEEKKMAKASSSDSIKDKDKKKKKKGGKAETRSALADYAMQYGGEKEKGKEKRRSYLPYRQDLVGFFTNSSVMSKNIHPY